MPHRLIQRLVGLALGLVLVLGGELAFNLTPAALAQSPTGQPTASHAMHPLPPELTFLRNMTPDQRFDHTLGGQVTFVNPQGQQVVVHMIPGKVSATTTNSVTITPNGTSTPRAFTVTSNTYVVSRPTQGSLSAFKSGDRVVIFAVGNSNDAAAIVEARGAMPMMR